MTSLGVDLARLEAIPAFLDATYVNPGRIAGFELSVLRRGQLVVQSRHGLADLARGRRLEPDALFRIYSMTKPITTVAFMSLVERGLVSLDDPVHRYIPAWKNLAVYEGGVDGAFVTRPTSAPMRIIDLLRHTSGLTYDLHGKNPVEAAYSARKLAWSIGPLDIAGFIDALADLPLIASPAEVWNYSVSTDVLGYLIGLIADKPFEEVLQEKIFGPLGMTDTGFCVPAEKADRLTACYRLDESGDLKLFDDPQTSPFLRPPRFHSGGGGLVSTSADYLQFVRMLLGRGQLNGVRVLAPKTLDLMTSNHIPGGRDLTQASVSMFSEATYAGVGFGLGFAVTLDPAKAMILGTPGEYFWGGMASTYFWVDPKEDLACVLMTQLIPSSAYPIRRQLRNMVYAALSD